MRDSARGERVIPGAETIDMQEEGSHGVLLLHGFGDTPQTLRGLAFHLREKGYAVYAPLLPGHGLSMRAFTSSRASEWITESRRALHEMQSRFETVSLVGLSMGGALAVINAAGNRRLRSLVLIAPYLGMPTFLSVAARVPWLWGRFAGEVNARNPRSIRDPLERGQNLAYGAVTARALHELWQVVRKARRALPDVVAPTLVIQSKEDPRISIGVARRAMVRLGAREKKIVWTEGAGHIITVDFGRERVFAEVELWLATHA